MAKQAVPLIRREHYETIRSMPNHDIPDSFGKWEYEVFEKRAKIQGVGHIAVDIEIDPQEFAAHRAKFGRTSLREAIIAFAADKLARKL